MCAANFEIFQKSAETVICKIELNPSPPDPRWRENINLSFYFRTSLWCFKKFKGLKGLHKALWGTKKKCEHNLSQLF